MSIVRTLGFIAFVAAGAVVAATPINQTRPLAADGQVSIDNLKGRIVVRTWAQAQVRITGSLGKGVEKLVIEGDGRSLKIQAKYPQNSDHGWFNWGGIGKSAEPTTLEVTVPARASVDVDGVSADIDVQGIAGRKLSVASVSGDVVVSASSPGEASIDNVSGDLTLRMTSPKVKIETVSGDLSLFGGFSGDLNIDSVSGNVKVTSTQVNQVELSTVSGDATLNVALLPNALVKADTLSGGLTLVLPKSTSAQLHAETFSGDIVSPSGHVEKEDGPGETLDTKFGAGQGRIKLETFSGDLNVELQQ
jgi:DUF4097 and DUF4098 domain-containing protein YvlB